jgi:tRNA threonylcarbamoyl adenosine modification protein YeaZ
MERTIIGLCTSGSSLKIAVSSGGRVLQAQKKIFNQEQALFPLLERELKKAGSDLRSVGTVCAARGPGRFTGIRISLTLAGALKAMAGAAVYTATSFEILALQAFGTGHFRAWAAANRSGRMAALLHAFKDEYFCQFFTVGGKLPRPAGEPVWLKADELKALLAGAGAFYAVADSEEDPGIYGLLPAAAAAAPKNVSRVLPGGIIKAALAYKCRTLRPLYLKPAKYELENNVRPKPAR